MEDGELVSCNPSEFFTPRQPHRYYANKLCYDMWPEFFPDHMVKSFKQWMFNHCPLWKEYRSVAGTTAPQYVGRTYNWFGSHGI